MAYDIFISYRRSTGADDARLLQQALKARGYNVFFDYESLRDGKFDENIYKAIDEAPIFILMLTKKSLDRCSEEGDWVRSEIERAISSKKKIVPVKTIDLVWEWPGTLPESLRCIKTEEISDIIKTSYFEGSIDEIIKYRFPETLRKRSRSTANIFSTVSSASTVFVGREEEMAKLHELLVAGKFPIITGPGGTGKSELARQYAKSYQNEYPGGLFQIDMEKANSWDTALTEKLLSPASAPGADVCGILGIEKKNEKEEKIDLNAIISALNRCAEQRGNILLVLDNVESIRTFLREPNIEKLKFHPDIRLLITSRRTDFRFRPNDHCVEFPLEDLSSDAAFTLLLNDHPVVSEEERKAAQDIAQMLGFRVLYLRSIPALLDDIYAPYDESFVKLRDALKENLLETVGEAMNGVGDEDRTPDVLWEMTRQALLQHTNGPNWVKLAQIASFFSPEGFKLGILYYLWRELIEAYQNCRYNWEENSHFMQAINILKIHGLLETRDNKYSIHRLTREVVKQSALRSDPSIADNIGRSLAKETIDVKEWLLFSDNLSIISHIPERYFCGDHLYSDLLLANNDYQSCCPLEKLNGMDWCNLLSQQPQFADKCLWEKLDGMDWCNLLSQQPQFADKCLWEKLNVDDWVYLLIKQPQFADKCPWDELYGFDWVYLLSQQPQFADKCPWERLRGFEYVYLLSQQPQFADKCPWDELYGFDWVDLLSQQPQFADKCSWEILKGSDWAKLLSKQPQFADKCPWERLRGTDWGYLLSKQFQFADKCPWEEITNWGFLLSEQLQLADKCPWDKLDGENWTDLLAEQPQFADKCSWEKLEGSDWAKLLSKQPQFAEKCSWKKLNGVNGENWSVLLRNQPQFAEKCPWEKLEGSDWAKLLSKQPQFAEKCPWEKIEDWGFLLTEQPQFSDKHAWEESDGLDLAFWFKEQPWIANICPWESLSGEVLANLLSECPQLADKCSLEKLEGSDWVNLLSEQPQFADKCSWEKLDEEDWDCLLKYQPQFADKRSRETIEKEENK